MHLEATAHANAQNTRDANCAAAERVTRREAPSESALVDDVLLRLRPPPPVRKQELEPGTLIARRYVIQGCLGRGGMGLLFRAFDTQLRRQVALKILHTDRGWSVHSNPRTRILREARAAAALTHWNVVSIHDVGEHEGMAFMAMEYVEGHSLAREANEPGTTIAMRLRWLVDVAHVLEAAHQRGLIHRDIKPDNVMITRHGEVKVLDFGIARYGEGDEDASTWIVGTPGYMPPEQNRGEDIDARADQFAWAVTAYESFTGRLPWRKPPGDNDAHYGEPLPLGDDVPPRVARVILRAMEMRPSDRFVSMRDLLASLVEAPAPVSARPVPVPVRGGRVRAKLAARRDPTRPLMALLVVALIVHGLTLLKPASGKTPPAAAGRIATLQSEISLCNRTSRDLVGDGLAALRDANGGPAHAAFEKAVAADPLCGEANLYLVVTGEAYYPIVEEREQLHRAQRLRDTLRDRERILLDAWSHIVVSEPPDREAAARVLEVGTARFAHDAQWLVFAAAIRVHAGHDRESAERGLELARQATSADPKSAAAWQVRGAAAWRLGLPDEARTSLDRCLDVSPDSADCISDRSTLLSNVGACEEAAGEARHAISRVPTSRRAHRQLAHALASAGAPEDDVRTALHDHWALLAEPARSATRLHDLARLAALHGRFDEAEVFATDLATAVASDPSLAAHQRADETLVELFTETARPAEAAAVAQRFLHLKDAWAGTDLDTRSENQDMGFGHEPNMLAAISRDGWTTATDAWEKRARKLLGAHDAWAYRFGAVADTTAIAELAWRDRPPPAESFLPGGWLMPSPVGLHEGHIALRAGQSAEARALLGPATRTCRDLDAPFARIRAHQWLGEAKERLGDIPGACEAYGVVLQHWGEAAPGSITAAAARGRSRALGCAIDRKG